MASTFPPGHVVAERYRILDLLGVGQTAEVYLAEDLSLQRRVVVKVLLADLAAHEEVRRAFRDRIIRASTLSHSHLARVFDGGQESGAIFMISEYLSGGSFEDILRSERRLSVEESARLGRDVANALAYLHEHGFILGALSPSKLLFDDEGRVRVSDIALTGLASGYRERMSLDDARYLAPEQAIGEPPDAKSDVYALALILFEAVTGHAAFEGSTPEALLRARLNAPLPVRLELGTLDMILAQAAVPDPRLRLDAEQFAGRLGGVVGDAAPLIVRANDEPIPLMAQFSPQQPRNSIGFRAPSADQIASGELGSTGGFSRVPRGRTGDHVGAHAAPGPIGHTPRFDRPAYELPRAQPRRWGFAIVALLIVLLAVGAGAAWKLGVFAKKTTVPDLVGMSFSKASGALVGDGFTLSLTNRVNSPRVPPNDIVSQLPAAGSSAKAGTVITVVESKGPVLVRMPTNLIGETCAKATSQLLALHVTAQCPSSAAIYSTTTPLNDVARVLYHTTPNPTGVPRGATVTLSLSKGPSPTSTTPSSTSTTTTTLASQGLRAVPNVVGDNQAQVNAAMRSASLYYSTTGPNSNSPRWTTVVSQSPLAGTMVKWHSYVTLKVR